MVIMENSWMVSSFYYLVELINDNNERLASQDGQEASSLTCGVVANCLQTMSGDTQFSP